MSSPETDPGIDSAPSDPEVQAAALKEKEKRLARRTRVFGGAVYSVARVIYSTLRLQVENLERATPSGAGSIIVTWHGRTLIPATVFRNRGYWALISLSRDGEMQDHIFRKLGYRTVRGSTGKGGVRGALQMARKVKEGGVLTFTPDGPRGPTHKVQPGVVLMAEKSGAPVVPIGVSADRRWLARSWDSYMVPKPFARAVMLVGEPIYVPPKTTDEDRAAMCVRIERAINLLEKEAERRTGHHDYPPEWPTD
jgi:lysophospholipid acyltransferase (LPLAT)-like uncharacterized protein